MERIVSICNSDRRVRPNGPGYDIMTECGDWMPVGMDLFDEVDRQYRRSGGPRAFARDGSEIRVGRSYVFAEVGAGTDVVRRVVEIVDRDAVRVDDHWKSTRWARNALREARCK